MVDGIIFFLVIAVAAGLGIVTLFFLEEPKDSITDVREDGTVELITVE